MGKDAFVSHMKVAHQKEQNHSGAGKGSIDPPTVLSQTLKQIGPLSLGQRRAKPNVNSTARMAKT